MAVSRLRALLCVPVLLGLLLAPGLVMAQATGVPDAPPQERILARHEGFELPGGFRTADGRLLPEGTYDLLVIESGDRYYIQLTNTETRKGIRVGAEASGELLEEVSPEASVDIESEKGQETFRFNLGELTVATTLRKAG
ncbi:MAG: hypothetical protein PVF68_09810 [Acidobacteriota bacterium]|jgi:hypothetical protein